jgi:hypothetical protein
MRNPHYLQNCVLRFHAENDGNIRFNLTEVMDEYGLDPDPCGPDRRMFKFLIYRIGKGLHRKPCPIGHTGDYYLDATPEQHTSYAVYRLTMYVYEHDNQIDRVEGKLSDPTLSEDERNAWFDEHARLRREKRKLLREIKALETTREPVEAAAVVAPEAEAA